MALTPNERAKAYRARHPDRVKAAQRKYRDANLDTCIERCRAWTRANPEKLVAYADVKRGDRPKRRPKTEDELREYQRVKQAEYRAKNPDKARAFAVAYRERNRERVLAIKRESEAARKLRTPPWSDRDACRALYELAVRITECTGIKFEVDHIIPLLGKNVSGLHVPLNLRVIPALANWKKGNR